MADIIIDYEKTMKHEEEADDDFENEERDDEINAFDKEYLNIAPSKVNRTECEEIPSFQVPDEILQSDFNNTSEQPKELDNLVRSPVRKRIKNEKLIKII